MGVQKFLTICILLGTLSAHIWQKEIFPFSNYPMYSRPLDFEIKKTGYDIVGVYEDGHEGPLQVWRFMKPFWYYSLQTSILSDPQPEKIQSKMKAGTLYYNQGVGAHVQHRIKGLKIYEISLDWPKIEENIMRDKRFNGYLGKKKKLLYEASL